MNKKYHEICNVSVIKLFAVVATILIGLVFFLGFVFNPTIKHSSTPSLAPLLNNDTYSFENHANIHKYEKPVSSPTKVWRDGFDYWFQLASFSKLQEAEELVSKTITIGIDKVSIKPHQSNNGKTWYRVLAGSYRSKQEYDNIKKLLSNNDIASLVIEKERDSF